MTSPVETDPPDSKENRNLLTGEGEDGAFQFEKSELSPKESIPERLSHQFGSGGGGGPGGEEHEEE